MTENPFALQFIERMAVAHALVAEQQARAFESEREIRHLCSQCREVIAQSRQLLRDLADFR